jgi:hypothetical protein
MRTQPCRFLQYTFPVLERYEMTRNKYE